MADLNGNGNGSRARVAFTPTISLGHVIVLVVAVVGGMWELGSMRAACLCRRRSLRPARPLR